MAVIEVSSLSKQYNLYNSFFDRFKEGLHPLRKKYHKSHKVLDNISFSVNEGDVLGIIGRNGCGKSTMLKILAGVLTPTSGGCVVNGKVSALLELGSGFNPEYSGMENIYFSASLMGFSKKEIDERLQDIIDFANIGEYIHQPVKTYSSGMAVRLAFAVSINIDPDILIVDEALSVGDIRFQQKSLRKMKELMEKAKAIIFVTHDMGAVLNFCNRAIWLKDGAIYQEGAPESVCKDYLSYMSHNQVSSKKQEEEINIDDILDDESVQVHVDRLTLGEKFLNIEGWCLNSREKEDIKKSLYFKGTKSNHIYEAEALNRDDVALAYPDSLCESNNFGYKVMCPAEILEDDEFEMYLLLKYSDDTLKRYFINHVSKSSIELNLSQDSSFDSVEGLERYGQGAAEIKGVALKDGLTGSNISLLKGGEHVDYLVKINVKEYINSPIVGIIIKDNYGNQLIGINSFIYNQHLDSIESNQEVIVKFNFRLPLLKEGVYTISPAMSNGTQDEHVVVDWVHDATVFEVRTSDVRQKIGVFFAPDNVLIEMN